MKRRIKIWFHSDSSSAIKEFSIHQLSLWFLAFFFIAFLGGAGFVGYDYLQLKHKSFNNATLKKNLVSQKNEIGEQRNQIQKFANEIELLKKSVDNLSKFEDKVRLIADIKQTSDSSGLIGIGAIPDNGLDMEIPIDNKHNNLIREMHQQVEQTTLAANKQSQDFEELIKQLGKKKNLLACTPSIRPVGGWITSKFGYRTSPFTGQKEFHSGLDISNKSGKNIVATANGTVSYAGRKMLIGKIIILDHGYGRITKYGHLKKILVKRGQKIKRGDIIGKIGNTGRSTGPHVHYEVRINGTPVNPLKYILN
ncbi:MAG: M23 family metallopeptidase [Desulfobacteraceae bacterium]|nr:M23 family metallopeptidase [Desulfobacteraceae bacterium]